MLNRHADTKVIRDRTLVHCLNSVLNVKALVNFINLRKGSVPALPCIPSSQGQEEQDHWAGWAAL